MPAENIALYAQWIDENDLLADDENSNITGSAGGGTPVGPVVITPETVPQTSPALLDSETIVEIMNLDITKYIIIALVIFFSVMIFSRPVSQFVKQKIKPDDDPDYLI
jgi:hypothetical protein